MNSWRTSENSVKAKFAEFAFETVWKLAGGFLIARVSCFKRARWDIFALFWLLATLQIEAYWDFPDSLYEHFIDGTSANRVSPKLGVFRSVRHGGTFEGGGLLLYLPVGGAHGPVQVGLAQEGTAQVGKAQEGIAQ